MALSVLIVEDDVALSGLLEWHLKSEGYDVRVTPDGEEALLMVRESQPDLIVLDWMVESLSGIEVCRQLRRAKETARLPILMLTARGEEEDRIRGLKTGADDYVTKPFPRASCSPGSRRCCAAAAPRWKTACCAWPTWNWTRWPTASAGGARR